MMNRTKKALLSLALLVTHSLDAKIVTYPAGTEVKTLNDFSVEVCQDGGVNFRISYNPKYCVSTGRGIQNVLVKDVIYNGTGENLSIIAGYDEHHKISGVKFVNLVINGRKITDDMPGKPKWYKTGDMAGIFIGEHVEDVTFE